ncbi:hypothetical protein ACN93_05910 [Gordonia paraffinivorans]|uniref:WXG100-like domain-containing protein n=1 Tax=Gordonia paraffinivorans TaxID=175628 RepID=UPI000D61819F|nr:hypothetical protein [Gordonia paraffinivorans]PWD43989.1 hypothetical protein ACN93_05910 [Gordonia paraffinivorans]
MTDAPADPIIGVPGRSPREIAEALVPGIWPTADVDGLRTSAQRARALAESVERVADVVASATSKFAEAVAGEFGDGVVASLTGITRTAPESLPEVAGRLRALASSLDDYADVVTEARQQMAAVALVADRDRLRAEVLAEAGDGSWQVSAASAGRMALTAAGDDLVDRSAESGQSAGSHAPPAATAGMLPFAPMTGALGAAGAAAAGAALGAIRPHAGELGAGDLAWLRRRADALQATVPAPIAGWFRTAVGVGVSARGRRLVVVGTNDPQPYQRPGLELADDEALTADGRAPELAIVEHMRSSGIKPVSIASATPMEPATVAALRAADIVVLDPGSPW